VEAIAGTSIRGCVAAPHGTEVKRENNAAKAAVLVLGAKLGLAGQIKNA